VSVNHSEYWDEISDNEFDRKWHCQVFRKTETVRCQRMCGRCKHFWVPFLSSIFENLSRDTRRLRLYYRTFYEWILHFTFNFETVEKHAFTWWILLSERPILHPYRIGADTELYSTTFENDRKKLWREAKKNIERIRRQNKKKFNFKRTKRGRWHRRNSPHIRRSWTQIRT